MMLPGMGDVEPMKVGVNQPRYSINAIYIIYIYMYLHEWLISMVN